MKIARVQFQVLLETLQSFHHAEVGGVAHPAEITDRHCNQGQVVANDKAFAYMQSMHRAQAPVKPQCLETSE